VACEVKPPRIRLELAVNEDENGDVALDTAAVCPSPVDTEDGGERECGTQMTYTRSAPTGGGEFRYYACPSCYFEGRVKFVPVAGRH